MRYYQRIKKHNNPEGQLQLTILKYLKFKGIPAGKIKTFGARTQAGAFIRDYWQWTGLPDILAFTPEILFLEVKTDSNTQTENQIAFQNFCTNAKVKYFVVKSLEDVQKIVG